MIRWPFFDPGPMRELLDAMSQDPRRYVHSERGVPMPVNVYQEPDALVIEALIPGAGPEDVEIHSGEGMLTIRATSQIADREYMHQEIRPTQWHRQLALPADLKFDEAQASSENGVLVIRIPKPQPRQPEKIRIQVTRKDEPAAGPTIEAKPGSFKEVKPKGGRRKPADA
ncbi:MAG TPA: Hsp20/alpha crystallin family protein [Candidatus Dormibacteraeota bacterium]